MKITWFGHSAFQLEADGNTLLVDPFITDNPAATVDATSLNPNVILLTHAHTDHVGDTIAIAKRTGATVVATFELATWLGKQGVEHVEAGNHGGTIAFDGGSVKFTQAWHTSSYETDKGDVAPGVPAGLVVRFGGKTTYFAGDTCLFSDMQLIADEGLDIAVVPIGDRFTMGPDDAVKAVKYLRAGTVLPCHYNTFPPIQQNAQAFKAAVEAETVSIVTVLDPGASSEV